MNYLHDYLNFTTVEEGEKLLKEAYELRERMGGQLYYGILTEDCIEIAQKLESLRREQRLDEKNKK